MAVEVVAEYLSGIGSVRATVFQSSEARETVVLEDVALLPESPQSTTPADHDQGTRLALVVGVGVLAERENSRTDASSMACEMTTMTTTTATVEVSGLVVDQRYVQRAGGHFEVKARVAGEEGLRKELRSGHVDARVADERRALESAGSGCGALRCAKCGSTCARFERVDRLPSSTWMDSATRWFCACSGVENALLYLEQVEDGMRPDRGKCLLGETVVVVSVDDVVATARGDLRQQQDRTTEDLRCSQCGSVLGIVASWQSTQGGGDGEGERAATLFKYALSAKLPGECPEDVFSGYTPSNSLAYDLAQACQSAQTMKFLVREEGGAGRAIRMTVLSPRVVLGHARIGGGGLQASTWAGPCMKVLYEIVREGELAGREGEDMEVTVPSEVGSELASRLQESTATLFPEGCAAHGGRSIGYLSLLCPLGGSSNILRVR